MQKFEFEELYNSYIDCIKNKKSSKDYLDYDLKHKKTAFEKLEKLLERLVIFINISNDLKLFGNSRKFLIYIETLVKVKKMVKCWNK